MKLEEDDDADDDSDDDGDDDDDDEDDEDDDEDDDDEKPRKRKLDVKDKEIVQLKGEAKKYRLKNREYRNRIAELEAELAKKGKAKGKDADDEDDESPSERESELEAQLEKQGRVNEDLLIRLEFMQDTQYTWKNPKAALRLLDLSDVEITEDGEVEGLDDAIKALAKSDPYLLADKADKDDEDEDDDEDDKPRRRTGTPPSSKRKKGQPNADKLRQKYPALRR